MEAKFEKFAAWYCGTESREEQVEEFTTYMLDERNEEISEKDLEGLYKAESVTITEQYIKHNAIWSFTINGKFSIDSTKKLLKRML